MKKAVTKRQRSELARRESMPLALIERPLRLIAYKLNTKDKDGNTVESFVTQSARRAADRGNGALVRSLAAQVNALV